MAKDADDPYNHFLTRFTGQSTAKPHRRTPYNLWCEIHGKDIEQELETMVNQGELTEKQKPGRCQKMRSDRYCDLSEEERDEWLQRSEQEHATAMEAWRAGGNGKVPDDPLDIQKCIDRLPEFIQPIIDIVVECTRGKLVLLWGGPEPRDGGHLNVVSICSGTMLGPH
ncbi:uncharacterized protein EV420DRAFT_1485436 [Desarmillaria tabescens]|uniref:Uncharacterized protein n=1 Tax=Armillaria tabescens TaxID=1929756 RepID=A0AA39JFU2_ARMTA|nr:uncharacterized protein EV420DRAFT_1485436 [Desarmillaria tabescens]KAK0441996.1 hypothetical protein EV420DRAFT_1485436 [Desarmillaria tabescens]